MARIVAVLLLLLGLAIPADAAKFLIRCERNGTPGEAYIKRIPKGSYPRAYPACIGVTADRNGCVIGFCPNLAQVVGCYLNPHCEAAVQTCTAELAGDQFNVRVRRHIRLRVGGNRVVLRCVP